MESNVVFDGGLRLNWLTETPLTAAVPSAPQEEQMALTDTICFPEVMHSKFTEALHFGQRFGMFIGSNDKANRAPL